MCNNIYLQEKHIEEQLRSRHNDVMNPMAQAEGLVPVSRPKPGLFPDFSIRDNRLHDRAALWKLGQHFYVPSPLVGTTLMLLKCKPFAPL